jgi:hypothetical protein
VNDGIDWASVVFLAAALILPLSALAGRQLSWKRWVVMALAWAWIFVLLVILITALGYG